VVLQIRVIPGISVNAFDDTVALVGNPNQLVIQVPWDSALSNGLTPVTPVSLYINKDTTKMYPVKYTPEFFPISSSTGGLTTGTTGTIT
jgi:hypothetical protein